MVVFEPVWQLRQKRRVVFVHEHRVQAIGGVQSRLAGTQPLDDRPAGRRGAGDDDLVHAGVAGTGEYFFTIGVEAAGVQVGMAVNQCGRQVVVL